MSSLLLKVPYDVLLKITYLSASDAVCRAPTELLALHLTCRTLHRHLDVTTSAQLYARLFQCHFDLSPLLLHSATTNVNDSTLAAEYILRQQFLARSRTSSWSDAWLASDMWTALRMVAENEGRNVRQLIAANFPRELLQLARTHLLPNHSCATRGLGQSVSESQALKHAFVWLLSLTLSKSAIGRMTPDIRDETCKLLRPYASNAKRNPSGLTAAAFLDLRCKAPSCGGKITSSNGGAPSAHHYRHQEPTPTLYARRDIPVEWLNPAFAAVNVMMATKESSPLLIPPHVLPLENRTIANLRNASGPTMEDFRQFQSYQTPLFADSLYELRSSAGGVASASSKNEACAHPPTHRRTVPQALATTHGSTRLGQSSWSHDPEFAHVYGFSDPAVPTPGTFSGLWQGSYMTSAVNEAGEEVYSNRSSLQAVFTEYHCFRPNTPLPSMHDARELTSLPTRPWEGDDLPSHRYEMFDAAGTISLERGSALESPDSVSQFTEGDAHSQQHQTQSTLSTGRSGHESAEIVDTILFGETTPDHDEAWKGFRYVGRIYGDGRVYLKREPKYESDNYLGTWMFEGKLRFGRVIVGFWRSQHSSEEQVARGIFSLTKATRC